MHEKGGTHPGVHLTAATHLIASPPPRPIISDGILFTCNARVFAIHFPIEEHVHEGEGQDAACESVCTTLFYSFEYQSAGGWC
jgi:hypothetical protein